METDIDFKVADSKESTVTIVKANNQNVSSRIRRRISQGYPSVTIHCFTESEFEKLQVAETQLSEALEKSKKREGWRFFFKKK